MRFGYNKEIVKTEVCFDGKDIQFLKKASKYKIIEAPTAHMTV